MVEAHEICFTCGLKMLKMKRLIKGLQGTESVLIQFVCPICDPPKTGMVDSGTGSRLR